MNKVRTSLFLSLAAGAMSLMFSGGQSQARAAEATEKPTLYIIGDSTVKNGRDDGRNGQWGWGHMMQYYFDPAKINVENDALGGTSSRTYFEKPELFPKVLSKLHAGDYVMMQFGHNDNTRPPESDTLRYRSTIKGNGEETVVGPSAPGGKTETIHTYGWYMRQMIHDVKEKGATPIVCSLIPRDSWHNGKVNRAGYADWAKEAAEQGGAAFLPLNHLIAEKYDKLGQEKVTAEYFPPPYPNGKHETTHTNWKGAKLNAACVVEGIKQLDLPLKNDLRAKPELPEYPPATDKGEQPKSK